MRWGIVASMSAPDPRRLAVTESMGAGSTLRLTWIPERAGNWLFHCHIPEHFERRAPLGIEAAKGGHGNHATDGMSGLVMGITCAANAGGRRQPPADRRAPACGCIVRPRRGSTPAVPQVRVRDSRARRGAAAGTAGRPAIDPRPGARSARADHRREPARRAHGDPLAWHRAGELLRRRARIQRHRPPRDAAHRAGDSFVVRFTPPRAGTFIYHTHADESRQQHAGLPARSW